MFCMLSHGGNYFFSFLQISQTFFTSQGGQEFVTNRHMSMAKTICLLNLKVGVGGGY